MPSLPNQEIAVHAVEILEQCVIEASDALLEKWIEQAVSQTASTDAAVRGRTYIIVGLALLEQERRAFDATLRN